MTEVVDEQEGLISGFGGKDGGYGSSPLPDSDEPLAEGGIVDIYDISRAGFLAQYFAVGMVLTGLPSTVYGLFLGWVASPLNQLPSNVLASPFFNCTNLVFLGI
jgi:hypothetical protein